MKRKKNKSTATGRSPYKTKNKKPHKYSAVYQAWFNAHHQSANRSASVNS